MAILLKAKTKRSGASTMSFTNQANLANLAISVRGIGLDPGFESGDRAGISKHDGQTALVLEDPDEPVGASPLRVALIRL